MKFYISGALHGSADLEDARRVYDKAASIFDGLGVTGFLPHKQTDPVWASGISSDEVYLRDVAAIEECAGVLVFLNEPSHGVGAEVAMCLNWQKPVFPVLHASRTCSRFLEGMLLAHGHEITRYRDIDDLQSAIGRFVSKLRGSELRKDGSSTLFYGT